MGQAIAKRALVTKHASIYDTSVWARKYRHDFEALQLSEEQVKLMWDEYCKASAEGNMYDNNLCCHAELLLLLHWRLVYTI